MSQPPTLLQELSAELGIGVRDLTRIIMSGPRRYKVYEIAKRSGGTRVIAQPARDLKILQRYLLDTKLAKLPVHSAATGYVHGRNIAQNAQMHVDNEFVLKLDFENFFPSIKVADWVKIAKKSVLKFSPQDLAICNFIMFWGANSPEPRCLSIGAPTSPALSNIVMFRLDEQLAEAAVKFGVTYSRYADDITASGETVEAVLRFEKFARSLIARTKSPRLIFNEGKRGLYGKGQRRMVTGLVITPDKRVSIGRDRKRIISAMLHKVAIGVSDPVNLGKVKGLLGFCLATEPSFVSRMRSKYGNRVIDEVLRAEVPKRRPPQAGNG